VNAQRSDAPTQEAPLLRAEAISKGFPGVWSELILEHIDLDVMAGEVHTLLGENGAGKTVIANILCGFYSLSGGQLYVKGFPVTLNSPKDGLAHGIGMVHQALKLAGPLSVSENVMLGVSAPPFSFPLRAVEARLRQLSERYGLQLDPRASVESLSVGEQQRVEILKVLYHDPEVILLDEPTSLLTPDEADHLFAVLRQLAEEGRGVVFITHKLEEVMQVSDRVTVLKLGRAVATRRVAETSEAELTHLVFGEHAPAQIERTPVKTQQTALEVRGLHVRGSARQRAVKGVSFVLRRGEILGVAGVAGNGQSELVEAITGLRRVQQGEVLIFDQPMTNCSSRHIIDLGVAHIPEKRRQIGVTEALSVAENVLLKDYRRPPFSRYGWLNREAITRHTKDVVADFGALVPDLWRTEARILSGGNIQRLILGRETRNAPPLIVAAYPTQGLDAKAIDFTWTRFLQLRQAGSAILLVSGDLDEIMALSDRVAVMFEGKIVDVVAAQDAQRQTLGRMMAGASG